MGVEGAGRGSVCQRLFRWLPGQKFPAAGLAAGGGRYRERQGSVPRPTPTFGALIPQPLLRRKTGFPDTEGIGEGAGWRLDGACSELSAGQ